MDTARPASPSVSQFVSRAAVGAIAQHSQKLVGCASRPSLFPGGFSGACGTAENETNTAMPTVLLMLMPMLPWANVVSLWPWPPTLQAVMIDRPLRQLATTGATWTGFSYPRVPLKASLDEPLTQHRILPRRDGPISIPMSPKTSAARRPIHLTFPMHTWENGPPHPTAAPDLGRAQRSNHMALCRASAHCRRVHSCPARPLGPADTWGGTRTGSDRLGGGTKAVYA